MQSSTPFASTSALQRALTTPARGATPGATRRIVRDETLRDAMDENAPPNPAKAAEDDIPPENPEAARRMIGALAGTSRASTPLTLSALQTPTRQNHLTRGTPSTLAGSVVEGPTSALAPLRSKIAFRGDPNMITTFDKKTDGELYDLWTA